MPPGPRGAGWHPATLAARRLHPEMVSAAYENISRAPPRELVQLQMLLPQLYLVSAASEKDVSQAPPQELLFPLQVLLPHLCPVSAASEKDIPQAPPQEMFQIQMLLPHLHLVLAQAVPAMPALCYPSMQEGGWWHSCPPHLAAPL